MKKSLGANPYTFPMPVLMIATYGADGKVDVMNMAWGGMCANNMVALNITETHKTSQNIKERMAFTLSIADVDHLKEADFFGIASGNDMEDKFERSGLHAVKSEKVDAPVVEEFPLTLECKVAELQHTAYGFRVLGEIVDVLADEKVLDEDDIVDIAKLNAFAFDPFGSGYYRIGEKSRRCMGRRRRAHVKLQLTLDRLHFRSFIEFIKKEKNYVQRNEIKSKHADK